MRRRLPALALAIAACGMVAPRAYAQSAIQFKDKTDVAADAAPSSVVAADVNKDGKMDLAVSNSDAANVVVLLGDGKGAFTAAPNPFTVGDSPMSVATADLNGDGNADLLAANDLSDNVSVLLGNGTASLFGAALTADTGAQPESVVVAEFNHDNKLDLATADQLDGTVTVQFGKKDGTFQDARSYIVPSGPSGLAAGNLVGDAALDLVVSSTDLNLVVILQGNMTDGTFQVPDCTLDPLPPLCLNVATAVDDIPSPSGLAVGDLNGDTKLDIAVANEDDDTVAVFFNNGDGTFAAPLKLDVGLFGFPVAVAIADFDKDGKNDIVAVDSGNDDVTVFRNAGSGTFEAGAHFVTNGTPVAVATADVNGDTVPDIITANADTNDVSVLLNESVGGCTGDCDGSNTVSVDELVKGVNIALGNAEVTTCSSFDKDHSGLVTVDELVTAVNNALNGCTS